MFIHLFCRKPNGSSHYNNMNSSGKRPSPISTNPASKKRRSRSKSPASRSFHSKSSSAHRRNSNQSDSKMGGVPVPNHTDYSPQQHIYDMMTGKASATNGYPPASAATNGYPPGAAAGLWHPYLQQQQELQRINPALSMAFAERGRQEQATLHLMEMERAKAAHPLLAAAAGALNGFHNPNSMAGLGPLAGMGGPPPLIPTSQAKGNLPSAAHHSPAHSIANSSTNGSGLFNDRYPR